MKQLQVIIKGKWKTGEVQKPITETEVWMCEKSCLPVSSALLTHDCAL